MSERKSPPGYMDFFEAAAALGVAVPTLRSHYQRYGLKVDCFDVVYRGRRALFLAADVERVAAERKGVV
jgi:hypothetical protein